ncbi:response regulator transcription factor [Silanimonas lenta]|uniref:response regulator transcription factor n=1 Tax=Silanimonas lenta TaxID=265429 RepID=UPI000429FF76|nr:response regulator transcription factor [Silanimonas lenta]
MSAAPGTGGPGLRVALVEDDRGEAERVLAALGGAGHHTDWYPDGTGFMAEARDGRHDLFLIDWNLPDGEGVALVSWLHRAVGRRAPVIIFSRFDDDERIVEALAAGADDYITKPTACRVLLARIAAVLRRAQPGPAPAMALEHGPFRLDASLREVYREGERIELQPKEFDLAWYLFQHRDRLIRREELAAAVWGREVPGRARTLDTHLYTLRRKLRFAEHGMRLANVYREGYRLETTGSEAEEAPGGSGG